jgi:DNA-binding NtrC family response regulator
MTLDSRLGEGTCVTIDLPASPTDTWPTETIVSAKDTVLGTKVLVAEDNEQLLLATARILSDAGYDVAIAKDGAEAKAQIDKTEFALMFSDVVMPQPDGYTLVEYTREHSPKTRVLLTSGHTNGRNHSPGMEKVPLLWKPYTREELLATVSRALLSEPTSNTPPAKAVDVLPAPAPAAASAPAATEPDPTAPGQILLIEDDALMQAATKRVLTRAGYEVEVVDNAVDAKTALDSESGYVAVLCDLGLPGGAGPALLDWLLESHPALARRTLVVTGGATNPVGAALIQSGAYEVVLKPVRPAQLLERVVAICDTVAESSGTVTEATSLPLIETPPLVETTPHSKSTQLSATVLIVDDEEDLLRAYGRSLQTAGFTVTLARSAEEALQRLRAATFDAVATDIGLPGVDGLTLMRQIREIDPDLPVLLITGAPTVATATLAVEHNAICYLSKPFLPQELIDQVIRAVKAGQVVRLQRQLLAARSGADEFLADLPRTLERFEAALSQLYMVYQPIIRAHDSSVFGYEALLRSTEPSFSSPLEVVGAAEALGRVEDLGLRVRGEVGKMIADHPDHNELIFVNLHPSELRSELLCATTEPVLSNATRIVLEVTERTSLSLGPELSEDIGTLRNRGYRVAIDDLGEGYAGLSWLANLNPDIAKIDMSLVRDVHRLPLKRKIVGSLIEVCRGAGITSLGEGVETIEEANVLTELGCELLQGYYFGKPAKAFRQKSQGGL